MENNILEFKYFLKKPRKIVITTHTRPDADALGSSLSLLLFLQKKGHQAHVITPTSYPAFLNWMPQNSQVLIYTDDEEKAHSLIDEADCIVCNDFSSLNRIDAMGDIVRKSPVPKVLIDHHLEPEEFATYQLWDPMASSTCELIFRLIDEFDEKSLIDKDMASCVYAGIMTDTGSFRFPSTSKAVHLILAELYETGIDHSAIHRLIYDNNKLSRLRLLGYALSEKLIVFEDLNTALISLNEQELKRFNYEQGDTEGIVNYALSVSGIVFAAIIMEKDGMVKFSFRSVGDFNVSKFAKTHFNGGGHKNAAGGRSDLEYDATIKKFKSILPDYKDELLF